MMFRVLKNALRRDLRLRAHPAASLASVVKRWNPLADTGTDALWPNGF